MLSRGLGLEAGEAQAPYTDLEEGLWYREPVTAAWAAGLLPQEETSFRPDDPITAEETEQLLAAAAQAQGLEHGAALAGEAVTRALERQAAEGSALEDGILSRGGAAFAVAALLEEVEQLPS